MKGNYCPDLIRKATSTSGPSVLDPSIGYILTKNTSDYLLPSCKKILTKAQQEEVALPC